MRHRRLNHFLYLFYFFFSFHFSSSRLTYTSIIRMVVAAPINSDSEFQTQQLALLLLVPLLSSPLRLRWELGCSLQGNREGRLG